MLPLRYYRNLGSSLGLFMWMLVFLGDRTGDSESGSYSILLAVIGNFGSRITRLRPTKEPETETSEISAQPASAWRGSCASASVGLDQ